MRRSVISMRCVSKASANIARVRLSGTTEDPDVLYFYFFTADSVLMHITNTCNKEMKFVSILSKMNIKMHLHRFKSLQKM